MRTLLYTDLQPYVTTNTDNAGPHRQLCHSVQTLVHQQLYHSVQTLPNSTAWPKHGAVTDRQRWRTPLEHCWLPAVIVNPCKRCLQPLPTAVLTRRTVTDRATRRAETTPWTNDDEQRWTDYDKVGQFDKQWAGAVYWLRIRE